MTKYRTRPSRNSTRVRAFMIVSYNCWVSTSAFLTHCWIEILVNLTCLMTRLKKPGAPFIRIPTNTGTFMNWQKNWSTLRIGFFNGDFDMKTVERIIGFKRGTGGTSGVSYLKKALDIRFFSGTLGASQRTFKPESFRWKAPFFHRNDSKAASAWFGEANVILS